MSTELACNVERVIERAVGNDNIAHTAVVKMSNDQLDRLTGADEQNIETRKV